MEGRSVLIVDDEAAIREVLRTTLTSLGFQTAEASCGEEALSQVRSSTFDAVLLDINMPMMNGFEVCRRIRLLHPQVPIVIMSVRDTPDDVVEALDSGANDVVGKPFNLRELAARIRARMRGAGAEAERLTFRVGQIVLDPVRRTVRKGDRLIHLTPKEYELTKELMARAGKLVPHSRLLNSVWGPECRG